MNPLDAHAKFALSLMNPTPRAARSKDGPRYRITFDVDPETFEHFMNARELSGMVVECSARVTADNAPMVPVAAPASTAQPLGPIAMWFVMRCKEEKFREYLFSKSFAGHANESEAAASIKAFFRVASRRELDDPKHAPKAKMLMADYHDWHTNQLTKESQ